MKWEFGKIGTQQFECPRAGIVRFASVYAWTGKHPDGYDVYDTTVYLYNDTEDRYYEC